MRDGLMAINEENTTSDTSKASTSKFSYYVELTKPRITVMVLITVGVAAYIAGPTQVSMVGLINGLIGTFFIAASGSAFNQYLERYTDFMMTRTAKRPLPAQNLTATEVTTFGGITLGIGISFLALQTGWLATAPTMVLVQVRTFNGV